MLKNGQTRNRLESRRALLPVRPDAPGHAQGGYVLMK
jgi:hypothetical protein